MIYYGINPVFNVDSKDLKTFQIGLKWVVLGCFLPEFFSPSSSMREDFYSHLLMWPSMRHSMLSQYQWETTSKRVNVLMGCSIEMWTGYRLMIKNDHITENPYILTSEIYQDKKGYSNEMMSLLSYLLWPLTWVALSILNYVNTNNQN